MKTKPQSVFKSPEYRALLKRKNADHKTLYKAVKQGEILIHDWREIDRVNTIVIKGLLAVVKDASSVLRVIAKVNEEMKGMDLVQKCISQCDSEMFQAESVLRVRARPAS